MRIIIDISPNQSKKKRIWQDLNEGKINLSDFKKIIFKNDRRNAGYSVFPGGLYLKEVLYSNKL